MIATKLSICVFCGSRNGNDKAFTEVAKQTGAIIAKHNWRLVYGAGDVGLMGAIAKSCQENGGTTFGVIPKFLLEKEVGKVDLSTFVITENMHERKKIMFTNSDVIITLPGGIGSLDEFFELLTWTQLEVSKKPLYILNINGYWDPLIALIDHVIKQEFADNDLLTSFKTINSVDDLENDLLQNHLK